MSRRSIDDWLADIVRWGDRLESHLLAVAWGDFLNNTIVQDAVCKCLEAIGEAAGKIDEIDPQFSHQQFGEQLKFARRSRDRLSHGYFHIDLAIVWHTAQESVPALVAVAQATLSSRRP